MHKLFDEEDEYHSNIRVLVETNPKSKIVGIVGSSDYSFYMGFTDIPQLDRLIKALQEAREELTK